MSSKSKNFMETGKAMVIVLKMAQQLYNKYGEFASPATCPNDVTTAMNVVEDFIVNQCVTQD